MDDGSRVAAWRLMNETLVNTTKNMISEPPCRQQAWRREKKRWVRKCVFTTTHRHTTTLSSLSSLWLDCPIFYSYSALLNKRWKRGKGTSGGKYVSVCVCVCLLGLLPLDQMICVQQGVSPADMHKPYKVALYIQAVRQSSLDARWKEARTHWNRYALSLPYLPVCLS